MTAKLSVIGLLVIIMFAQGCTTFKATQPAITKTENSRVINKDFESTWNATMAFVADTFYIIDNIVKDSKIITLSFSSSNPSSFVDCGNLVSSKSSKSVPIASKSYRAGICDYSSRLSGKINIIMTSLSDDKTKVKVNTRYVVDWKQQCPGSYNIPIVQTRNFAFSTNGSSSNGNITCTSNSRIEDGILDGIESMASKQ
ncbi:hypothetical protein [Desulfovibrio inopinatus]|uniref:hypothetical protein n=1 Tax=Desulfovibrio inopinatus TaxID=102109 RepID=UPI000484EF87|nr:hypothetical protein [Desulfovibrio inopinatus]